MNENAACFLCEAYKFVLRNILTPLQPPFVKSPLLLSVMSITASYFGLLSHCLLSMYLDVMLCRDPLFAAVCKGLRFSSLMACSGVPVREMCSGHEETLYE
jgi:hypothetical protein